MGGVNPLVVVIADLLVHSLDELPNMVEPSDIAKLNLEVRVERFLIWHGPHSLDNLRLERLSFSCFLSARATIFLCPPSPSIVLVRSPAPLACLIFPWNAGRAREG